MSINLTSAQTEVNTSAWLDIKNLDGDSVLLGHFQNKSKRVLPLWYQIELKLKSPAGIINNNQEGAFVAMPYEKLVLSEVILKTPVPSAYIFTLRVFEDEKLLHTDIIQKGKMVEEQKEIITFTKPPVIPSPPPKKERTQSLEDLEIDGLIIDETRTKTGHDFYDLFYRKWVSPKDAKDYLITIKELPSIGRASRVSITVNDQEVVRRAVTPRIEMVESAAVQSIAYVKRHLQKRESLKESLGNEDQKGSGIF